MKTPTTPSTRQEGSATFSLGELMKLENERVAEQERDREEATRAAARAAEAVAAKASADAEADAAKKKRAELDELARRDAIQRAVVEQARLEVDARTRADERERERQHEVALVNARNAPPPPKTTGLGALAGATGLGGALMLVVAMVIHFAVEKPAIERQLTELDLRAGTAEQRASSAEQKIEQQQRMIAALEKNKSALEAQLATASNPAPSPVKPPPGGKPVPTRSAPKTDEKKAPCPDHDPMCS